MVNRVIENQLISHLGDDKAIIIQGARQVGKTTLVRQIMRGKENVLWINGDLGRDQQIWGGAGTTEEALERLLAGYEYVVFDEAQRIKNIGLTTKIIVDSDIRVKPILSGSSSLGLASTLNEALTGRKWSFELYPFSWRELTDHYKLYPTLQQLDERLILGSYPEIVTQQENAETRLAEITSSYLYKDIVEYGDVRKPEIITQLLRALAYEVGSQVSYNELSNMLQVSNQLIRRYVQLLEDSYVIFRLQPLSTNPRKEIVTSRKIYFVDNGIRNALIDNFSPLHLRNDQGQLWENFVVSETYKRLKHDKAGGSLYFWRSKNGAEVDLIYSNNGRYNAYEIKYNPKKRGRFPASFLDRYQPELAEVVNRDNFHLIY